MQDCEKLPNTIDNTCQVLPDPIVPPPICPEIPGPQGPKGDTGEKGSTGDAGSDGRDGKDGVDGRDGKNGKDAFDRSILPPVYITPPFNEDKLVSLNDAQMMLYDATDKIFYQYGLLNLDTDINHKTEADNSRIDGGTIIGVWTSSDLVRWEYGGIWIDKPESVTSVLTGGGIFWENEYYFYHSIDLGDNGRTVGLWTTPSLKEKPVYKGQVLSNHNMTTFRDPKITADNDGLRMVIAVDGGIGVYRSTDGYEWTYRSTHLIPNLGLIECPQLINTANYGWLMIFGGNEFATGGGTGSYIAQVTITNDVIKEVSRNRCDMGPDCYAASLYEDSNGGLIISYWVNSWDYFPNLLVDKINGYIKVGRVEKYSLDGNPVNDRFVVQPQKNLYKVLARTLEKQVTLRGDYSDIPILHLPDNCIIELTVNADIETGEFIELTHGSTSGFRVTKTDTGFDVTRADYGLRPVYDIKNWNKTYSYNFTNHGRVKITIEKAGPLTTIYIDDYKISATFLCYYPAQAVRLHYHGIVTFNEDGTIAHESEHTGFFKLFYYDLIRGTDGTITELEIEGIVGRATSDAITSFTSPTEARVRQITIDEDAGLVARRTLGMSVEQVPDGEKGVFVNKTREPLLIETQNDVDHLFLKTILIDVTTGFITLKGKDKSFSGYLSNDASNADFIRSTGDNHVNSLETNTSGYITVHTASGNFSGHLLDSSSTSDFIHKDRQHSFDFMGEENRQIFIGRDGSTGSSGWLGEQQDIVYSTRDATHLRLKYITIDSTTGYISFLDDSGQGINGYLAVDQLPDIIRSYNDQDHLLIKRIGVNDDAFLSFLGPNDKVVSGSLVTEKTMKYVIKSTSDWLIEQMKYDPATRTVSIIGPEGTISWKINVSTVPPVGSTTLKQVDYDGNLDRFTVTLNDDTQVYWSRFINKIEVVEE